ncbi:hypothetical protein [Parerythrobacter aestuarii]|uniref:hypothetical protein n=1 Tax=Parerythrobacter aestuarii TaxID=3020909 RepID=UPI0024DE6B29|nr:hypothetical protein [Parerythrobacter aestuarii]
MTFTPRGAAKAVAWALLATVATQIFYMAVVAPTDDALLRKATWTAEMALFSLVFVASLPLAGRSKAPLVWSTVALAGVVNVIQVGMGLAEFGPAREAADEHVFRTVLNGAFFLYFHGKAMMGLAAVGVGLAAIRQSNTTVRIIGGLSFLSGAAAVVLNLYSMANGMDIVFAAGAAGTVATAFFALIVLVGKNEP